MSTQISLTLPDEVYRRAEHLAKLVSRDVTDVLVEAISLSLAPVGIASDATKDSLPPVASLSDEEVMALSELQMEPEQDRYLSELLDKQQAGILTEAERRQLWGLMQVYQEKLLLKAQALREAVERGLRASLEA
jgi:hypothetical protein